MKDNDVKRITDSAKRYAAEYHVYLAVQKMYETGQAVPLEQLEVVTAAKNSAMDKLIIQLVQIPTVDDLTEIKRRNGLWKIVAGLALWAFSLLVLWHGWGAR